MPKKNEPKLTRKQKVFADELINNPKQSATSAALKAYDTTPPVAAVIASENLRKPNILLYLDKHIDKAQETIVEVMTDKNNKADTRLRAADSLLDRTLGKATLTDTSTNIGSITINFGTPDREVIDL
jgi:phage terminase small subunit